MLRNGVDGTVNDAPDGFMSWMFKVALYFKRDISNSLRKINGNTRNFEVGEEDGISDDRDDSLRISEKHVELLTVEFLIVIVSDSGVINIDMAR